MDALSVTDLTQSAATNVLPRRPLYPTFFLTVFYVLAVLEGLQGSSLGLLAFVLTWWVIADASAQGHPIPLFSRNWLILVWGVAVPCYLLWSRGWWGLCLLLLHTIGWCAVVVFAAAAKFVLVTGV